MKKSLLALLSVICLQLHPGLYDTIKERHFLAPSVKRLGIKQGNFRRLINTPDPKLKLTLLDQAIEARQPVLAKQLIRAGARFSREFKKYTAYNRVLDQIKRGSVPKDWEWILQELFKKVRADGHQRCQAETLFFYDYVYLTQKDRLARKAPIIPKKMHQIWIGPKPVPPVYAKMAREWKSKHPGWEYKLWTNKDIKSLKMKNTKQFAQAKNWGAEGRYYEA